MKLTKLSIVFSLLISSSAFATIKVGEVYRLTKPLTFSQVATLEAPNQSDGASVSNAADVEFVTYWSLDKRVFQKADKVAPGLCEFRIETKSAKRRQVTFAKDEKFKLSTPMPAEDAKVQTLKNCMIITAIHEKTKGEELPQIQINCCSEKDLPTPASRQEFNDQIQIKLKPILKYQAAK